jgi:hypothetical protein
MVEAQHAALEHFDGTEGADFDLDLDLDLDLDREWGFESLG